ncbi:hypothetical protein LF887_17600 [Chryseobacterium sp. MEBOG06]|uniref:hypothetical protein n=1 Tax=unclassified Chryseobacterium TaxID=2593645 RepID=UPI001F3120B3|nr:MULTISPECIES: hypothetical protein [unclassified Chryseobacterium]UKB82814.1 hypothetical protein LF887_17600 [Chryseobacterium sp. MEBOG06]
MDWKMMFHLKNKRKSLNSAALEEIRFFGKAKQEVMSLLSSYKYEYKDEWFCFILSKTWYGKKRIMSLFFENNKVEEKYIKTEYGKLSITKLYKNLS